MTENPTKGRIGYKSANYDEWLAEINKEELFPGDTTYALLERTENIQFVTKKRANEQRLFEQHWVSGRIFNAYYELHWEKQGGIYWLRLFTEGGLPEGWQGAEFEAGNETALLLFGERKRETDKGWREARIPRWLEYPVEKTLGRVYLIAIPYLKEGMVVRMRWKGVKIE